MSDANVTTYLLDRLAEAGVDRLFGVPGDFTLAMLDDVEGHRVVEWVGCGTARRTPKVASVCGPTRPSTTRCRPRW